MKAMRKKSKEPSTLPTQSGRRLFERVRGSGSLQSRHLLRRINSMLADHTAPVPARQGSVPLADSGSSALLVAKLGTGRTNVLPRLKAPPQESPPKAQEDLKKSNICDELWDLSVLCGVSEPIKGDGSSVDFLPIKDSLSKKLDYWREITNNGYVIDMVKNGFSIPFMEKPRANFMRNNRSALQEHVFVAETIRKFLNDGFVEEVEAMPTVVSPLSVTFSSGKKRFILDLRYVNKHIIAPKFKLDDVRVALEYVTQGCFMCSFDIKSGYYHLNIRKELQTYLGFAWNFNGKAKFFTFTVLPFGLSTGPFLFTKLLRPVIQHWRAEGCKVLIYIDDGFIAAQNYEKAAMLALKCKQDLENLGFFLNDKCVWTPVQHIKYLGFEINSEHFEICIYTRQKTEWCEGKKSLVEKTKVSAIELAKITGNIISCSLVLGSMTRLKTRKMYSFINSCATWDKLYCMCDEVKTELLFWDAFLSNCRNTKMLNYELPQIFSCK